MAPLDNPKGTTKGAILDSVPFLTTEFIVSKETLRKWARDLENLNAINEGRPLPQRELGD